MYRIITVSEHRFSGTALAEREKDAPPFEEVWDNAEIEHKVIAAL